MSKKLEIRVVDTNLVSEPGLCSDLKHERPHIRYYEYDYIDKALLCKTVDINNISDVIACLIRYFGMNELAYMVCDINEVNKGFAPAKEMTIDDIEKELGYKIKIVGKVTEEK
mgnify:CR=1 FL=1